MAAVADAEPVAVAVASCWAPAAAAEPVAVVVASCWTPAAAVESVVAASLLSAASALEAVAVSPWGTHTQKKHHGEYNIKNV